MAAPVVAVSPTLGPFLKLSFQFPFLRSGFLRCRAIPSIFASLLCRPFPPCVHSHSFFLLVHPYAALSTPLFSYFCRGRLLLVFQGLSSWWLPCAVVRFGKLPFACVGVDFRFAPYNGYTAHGPSSSGVTCAASTLTHTKTCFNTHLSLSLYGEVFSPPLPTASSSHSRYPL